MASHKLVECSSCLELTLTHTASIPVDGRFRRRGTTTLSSSERESWPAGPRSRFRCYVHRGCAAYSQVYPDIVSHLPTEVTANVILRSRTSLRANERACTAHFSVDWLQRCTCGTRARQQRSHHCEGLDRLQESPPCPFDLSEPKVIVKIGSYCPYHDRPFGGQSNNFTEGRPCR